jgi:hypothetical protein
VFESWERLDMTHVLSGSFLLLVRVNLGGRRDAREGQEYRKELMIALD